MGLALSLGHDTCADVIEQLTLDDKTKDMRRRQQDELYRHRPHAENQHFENDYQPLGKGVARSADWSVPGMAHLTLYGHGRE